MDWKERGRQEDQRNPGSKRDVRNGRRCHGHGGVQKTDVRGEK